jgi:hypothetical protein
MPADQKLRRYCPLKPVPTRPARTEETS